MVEDVEENEEDGLYDTVNEGHGSEDLTLEHEDANRHGQNEAAAAEAATEIEGHHERPRRSDAARSKPARFGFGQE
jgi:hypothetical protein